MDANILNIWNNNHTPVVYLPAGKRPLLVRVPYRPDNRTWLQGWGRRIEWQAQRKAWEIPRSRFTDIVTRCLIRYEQCYIIQAYRELRVCAPACWEAEGPDCECSCLGRNHGSNNPYAHVVSETYAFEWGEQKLACRLLTRNPIARGPRRRFLTPPPGSGSTPAPTTSA